MFNYLPLHKFHRINTFKNLTNSIHLTNYSYLNASTGFNFEACNAGKTPDKVPTINEKDKAPKIINGSIEA